MAPYEYPGVSSFEEPPLSRDELDNERTNLRFALLGKRRYPPGGSRIIREFAQVALDYTAEPEAYPAFNEIVDALNQDRQEESPTYRAQLLWLVFHYELMPKDPDFPIQIEGNTYPYYEHDTPPWPEWIDSVLTNPAVKSDLQDIVSYCENKATFPKRYAGVKMAILANTDILPNELTLHDDGSSVPLGLAQLKGNIPFHNIRIDAAKHVRDLIHKTLKTRLNFDKVVGLDLTPDTNKFYVEACTCYPEDIGKFRLDTQRQQLYEAAKNIRLLQGDITKGETSEGIADLRDFFADSKGRSDIASAVTSLNQVSKDDIGQALTTFESTASKLAVVQDGAYLQNDELVFYSDIFHAASPYNLFSKDLTGSNPYVLLGRWSGAQKFRCNTFVPSDDLVRMLESQQPLRPKNTIYLPM